jgi:hypothetical protein
MALIDTTEYFDIVSGVKKEYEVPELALRSIFVAEKIPSNVRKALAKADLTQVSQIAICGKDADAAWDCLSGVLVDLVPNKDGTPLEKAQFQVLMIKIKAMWDQARIFASELGAMKARYREDPSRIPVTPEHERLVARATWCNTHKDHDLNKHNEPHPRFVDRVKRDWYVHGKVQLYHLTDIRTASDKMSAKPTIVTGLDKVLKATVEDESNTPVSTEQMVFDRLHAMFVAFEMCKLIMPDHYALVGLRYSNELRLFHREHHGSLAALVLVDKKVREAVDKHLMTHIEVDYSTAFLHVLETQKYLWDSAASFAENEHTHRSPKRAATELMAASGATGSPSPRAAKRQKQREKKKTAQAKKPTAAPPAFLTTPAKGGGKGGKGGKGAGGAPPRIPKEEMDKLMALQKKPTNKTVCRWFNSSAGCSFGEACSFSHACLECGQSHSWARVHQG